jgi:hypothetical protein
MHKTSGLRDPAAASPLPHTRDDSQDRRQANRAVVAAALARQLPEAGSLTWMIRAGPA